MWGTTGESYIPGDNFQLGDSGGRIKWKTWKGSRHREEVSETASTRCPKDKDK